MMLFDSTLRRDLARTFGATLVVILTIVITMMLIRTLGLAAGGKVSPQDVVLLLGYTALVNLPLMLNLSLFVAVVATLGRMYRESEMAIWFASGAGLSRFVRPVLGMSWPVLLVVALLVFFVWPWGNRYSAELRERYERRSDLSRVAPGQFQTSRDGSSVFFIDRGSADGRIGRNVFILTTRNGIESVTSAHSGRLELDGDDRFLILDQGQRNEDRLANGEKTVARFDSYRVLSGERLPTQDEVLAPKARPTIELMRQPVPANLAELTWRAGLLLGGANLVLLGIGLAATNPRRVNNWSLLLALLAFVIYFNLINLSQAWVANARVGLGTALLVLHGSAFIVSLVLIWWREHAAVTRRSATPPEPAAA